MRVKRISTILLGLVAAAVIMPVQYVLAIPSPLAHVHNGTTVHWEQDGSPNGSTDHNHLTADNILVANKWDINKAWDNRTLRSTFNGDTDWAHGMILPGNAVRYGWGAGITADAKNVVESSYNDWIAKATTQFTAKKDPWDRLGLDFDRVNAGAKEITISFEEGLAGAYGVFSSPNQTIKFEATPTFELKTNNTATKEIRFKADTAVTGGQITVDLNHALLFAAADKGWSYDGTPDAKDLDLEYRIDLGGGFGAWADTAPGGFGQLDWGGAAFGNMINADDKISVSEMDFTTIALHEIGHSVALGHIGADLTAIMRVDIANFALFGNTMAIDTDSALAVAIDYTYAVPEPATIALLGIGLVGLAGAAARRKFKNGRVDNQ